MSAVSIVIPMLDEAAALPRLIRVLASLDPAPLEILAVDGGSRDDSVAIAEAAGLEFFQAQLQLVGQTLAALGAGAVLVTPQQRDLLLQVRDQRVSRGRPRLGCGKLDPHRRHYRLERIDVVGKSGGGGRHG